MIDSLYIAWKYINFNKIKTITLVGCITLISFLPMALQLLLDESERQLMSRAVSTPLVVGSKGSALDLVTKDQADVILVGKVESTSTSGLSYVRYDRAVERRITAECSVHLVRREGGKVIWQTGNIVREESFLVGKDVMQTEGLKDEALQKLSRDVAEIIYHRITGVF